jgi:hypothetical protein
MVEKKMVYKTHKKQMCMHGVGVLVCMVLGCAIIAPQSVAEQQHSLHASRLSLHCCRSLSYIFASCCFMVPVVTIVNNDTPFPNHHFTAQQRRWTQTQMQTSALVL